MFNNIITIEDLQAIVGEACNTVAHPQLTVEQIQSLLCTEALAAMARRDLAADAKDQARFNKELAAGLVKHGEQVPARIVDLFKNTMALLSVANTSGDNAQFIGAQVKLEMLLGFFNQFAGALARSSFYHYEAAMASEGKAIDLIRQGNLGSTGSVDSRLQSVNYYAGPRVAVVLPVTIEQAMDAIDGFLAALYNAGIGGASQWFKGINPAIQYGGRRDEGNDGAWVAFHEYHEMWSDTRAYKAEQAAINAQARSSALGSFLSALDGLAAAEKHGSISGDKPQPVIAKSATASDRLAAKQCGMPVKAWMALSEEEQVARLQAVQQ